MSTKEIQDSITNILPKEEVKGPTIEIPSVAPLTPKREAMLKKITRGRATLERAVINSPSPYLNSLLVISKDAIIASGEITHYSTLEKLYNETGNKISSDQHKITLKLPRPSTIVKMDEVEITKNTSLIDIISYKCSIEWIRVFSSVRDDLETISSFLETEAEQGAIIYPSRSDIFRAFQLCPFPPKVVILGQDPYYTTEDNGKPTATGLAFSVNMGVAIPPSLLNIYRAINNNYPSFKNPGHGNLDKWALQGILLLNTALTVEKDKGGGKHMKKWLGFTAHILTKINDANPNCIYLLWGNFAQRIFERSIKKEKATILKTSHPSPQSAHFGFFKCDHFKRTNELLKKAEETEIVWDL